MRLRESQWDCESLSWTVSVLVRQRDSQWNYLAIGFWEMIAWLVKLCAGSVTYDILKMHAVTCIWRALVFSGTGVCSWWFLVVPVILPLEWMHIRYCASMVPQGTYMKRPFFKCRFRAGFYRFLGTMKSVRNIASMIQCDFRSDAVGETRDPLETGRKRSHFSSVPVGSGGLNHRPGNS